MANRESTRLLKAREVTRCYRRCRCVVQGRPRSFSGSLDSRNARNKLVAPTFDAAWPLKRRRVESGCCEKTQGLHYYFPLSLFLAAVALRAPLCLLGTSRLVVPFLFHRQIRARGVMTIKSNCSQFASLSFRPVVHFSSDPLGVLLSPVSGRPGRYTPV